MNEIEAKQLETNDNDSTTFFGMSIDSDLFNFSQFVTQELRASSPYRTGNMQRSITQVIIDGKTIDVVIAVDYASYVNARNPHKGWVKRVLERCLRAYFGNDVDTTSADIGFNILEG